VKVNRLAGEAVKTIPGTRIYRMVHVVRGREIVTYSDRKNLLQQSMAGSR
jgi:hypothetical protein